MRVSVIVFVAAVVEAGGLFVHSSVLPCQVRRRAATR